MHTIDLRPRAMRGIVPALLFIAICLWGLTCRLRRHARSRAGLRDDADDVGGVHPAHVVRKLPG